MRQEPVFRIAEDADLPALARLRWALKTEDQQPSEGEAFAGFASAFAHHERERRGAGEIVHWIAALEGAPVAAMSVALVRKLPAPDRSDARWGYLTNCYVVPRYRNAGLGAGLLQAIQFWAKAEALEFLIVWPSARAASFYQRGGFSAPGDALVWTPES